MSQSYLTTLLFLSKFYETQGLEKECYMSVPTLIEHQGYPVEVHNVTTEDGYILELHRIPMGRNATMLPGLSQRPPVVFQHGLLGDSSNFVLNLPHQTPGFVFADGGFDVWLVNSRGSKYGSKHVTLSEKSKKFWNFTWYEMARYDLTAVIDYILNETKRDDVYYIGDSQGTMLMFAKLVSEPDFRKKVRLHVGWGPIASLSHLGALWKMVTLGLEPGFWVASRMYNSHPVRFSPWLHHLFARLCGTSWSAHICASGLGVLIGPEKDGNMNYTRFGLFACHYPSSTSINTVVNWMQMVAKKEMTRLDYGSRSANMRAYGRHPPPFYSITESETPTVLFWSRGDYLAVEKDVKEIIEKGLGSSLVSSIEVPNFSHYDFVLGLHAPEMIYKPTMKIIYDFEKKREM